MRTFKTQHPQDLITRLFILEFMREITPKVIYDKANEEQKKQFFYKFINNETNTTEVDFNWEALIFNATLPQLEYLLEPHEELILEIDKRNEENRSKLYQAMVESQAVADINIYDLAQAEINRAKDKSKLLLPEKRKSHYENKY